MAYPKASISAFPQQSFIRYDRRQVALMIKVTNFYATDEQKRELERLGALRYFNLRKDGANFVWNISA